MSEPNPRAQFPGWERRTISHTPSRVCAVIVLCLWCGRYASPCSAQSETAANEDRIVYGPALPRSTNIWNPPATITLTGTIESLDQNFLEITSAGQRRKLTSDRIERIDVAWDSAEAAAAHARFAGRQYAEALRVNVEFLRTGGIPKWQQFILLSELVESAEAMDRPELAGQLFLALARQHPPDYLIGTIPLNWTSRELTAPIEKAALGWLAQPGDDYAGLLGASWLLLTDQADAARQRLQAIQAGESKLLQRLAAMQLWRATPPSETSANIQRWVVARDSLSLPLQLGPSEFIAERLARVDKTNFAIGEWLRIAATHAQHAYRAELALKSAQMRLSRQDDQAASERITTWLEQMSTDPRATTQ